MKYFPWIWRITVGVLGLLLLLVIYAGSALRTPFEVLTFSMLALIYIHVQHFGIAAVFMSVAAVQHRNAIREDLRDVLGRPIEEEQREEVKEITRRQEREVVLGYVGITFRAIYSLIIGLMILAAALQ